MATPALAELNAQATGFWGRMKPSERRLLGLFVLAAMIGLVAMASDAAQKSAQRNAEAQANLDRARQALRRNQGSVANQVETVRGEVRGWSWTADTPEVGKVLVQSEVANLAKAAGLSDVEVKVADKVADVGGVKLVSLDVTAPFTWNGLSQFLAGLEGTGKGFLLDGVQLPDDDKPRMKIQLRAPLMVLASAPATSVKTPAKAPVGIISK